MVKQSADPGDSPDPLLLTDEAEYLSTPNEIIAERPPQPLPPTKRPRANTRTLHQSPASSPSRPTLTPAKPHVPSRIRTPLSRAPVNKPTPGRGDRTPGKAEVVSTLGSSIKALPTPTRPRAVSTAKPLASVKGKGKEKEIPIRTPTKRKVEDVFDDSPINSPNITRDAFLANEALKRQREARNFKYKGDAHAPRQTRSGRVVGESKDDDGDADIEYGGGLDTADVGVETAEDEVVEEEEELEDDGRYDPVRIEETTTPHPLSDIARQHLTAILHTITSQQVSSDPPPFQDEDKNEALQGLLKLLQGTVDRGEGNSALVTGPRGVGKTRVGSTLLQMDHC